MKFNPIEWTLKLILSAIWLVCSGIIKGFRIPDLLHWLKRRIKSILGKKPKYSLEMFENMTGKQFEHAIQEILEAKGYKTKTLPYNDKGVDLICEKEGLKIAVQCKRYSLSVGLHAIQEVFTGCRYYNCDKAWVITNNLFTFQAQDLAEKCGVRILDKKQLQGTFL
ncbi:Restriction endonuclease [uncultured archaeon]|nr:Restriction endonuclease [uncultured archaeon]